ncbi:unnamed protein product [Dovyalis caffra]|uniref:Uncharacterized protein n=1 Tax=Dovyalis caffra TaxID=77055 RepID=A0AAV1QY69_9ROSI|nr:unnamed protein product [Dovyalis caffra]
MEVSRRIQGCGLETLCKWVTKGHVKGSDHEHHQNGSLKLFVFGDSYADTGNWEKSAASWKEPYGFTFPGKPAGRFSDGRVLTDYIGACFFFLSHIFSIPDE